MSALFQILVVTKQYQEINIILSKLRVQGVNIKAAGTNTTENFESQLKEHNWDLMLHSEDLDISITTAIAKLQNLGMQLPIILLRDNSTNLNEISLVSHDIRDSIQLSNKDKITFALHREIRTAETQRKYQLLFQDYKQLEKSHKSLLDNTNHAIAYIFEGMHLYCNRSYADFFRIGKPEDIINTPLLDLFYEEARSSLEKFLSKKVSKESSLSLQLQTPEHNVVESNNIDLIFSPITYDQKACLQLILKPTVGNSRYRDELKVSDSHDLITRLYNKAYFLEKLEDTIGRAIKESLISSLLVIQVNEFLDIKSTIGLSNTNRVLSDISEFLRQSIKKEFSSARLGDYEFSLLIYDFSPTEAVELANFIKSKINNHITTTSLPNLQLSCSIGIVTINNHSQDAKALLARARANLNTTHKGNNSFEPLIDSDLKAISKQLEQALDQEHFKILFQPIINLKGSNTEDYEVISSMLDINMQEVFLKEYVGVADLNGLGERLDQMIISMALKALRKRFNPNIRLHINLNSNTLVSKTFLSWLSQTVYEAKVPSNSLAFQISEINICQTLKYSESFCSSLKQLGHDIIVCHYGCMLETEEYLDVIKPSHIKVDKTLTEDLTYSHYHQDGLKNIIIKLHKKRFKVIVPEIEDKAILPILWKLNVDFIQGCSLTKPNEGMNYQFLEKHDIKHQYCRLTN